jgi:hypothetical protein
LVAGEKDTAHLLLSKSIANASPDSCPSKGLQRRATRIRESLSSFIEDLLKDVVKPDFVGDRRGSTGVDSSEDGTGGAKSAVGAVFSQKESFFCSGFAEEGPGEPTGASDTEGDDIVDACIDLRRLDSGAYLGIFEADMLLLTFEAADCRKGSICVSNQSRFASMDTATCLLRCYKLERRTIKKCNLRQTKDKRLNPGAFPDLIFLHMHLMTSPRSSHNFMTRTWTSTNVQRVIRCNLETVVKARS